MTVLDLFNGTKGVFEIYYLHLLFKLPLIMLISCQS